MIFRIISVGGLGDGLLLTPALREIKERWPESRTKVYCLNRGHLELFRYNPYIDVLRYATFRSAPLARTMYYCRRSLFTGSWYGNFNPGLMGKHATTVVAEMLGFELRDTRLDMFLTKQEEIEGEAIAGKYDSPVGIHVTSTCSSNQNWTKERWEELVRINPQHTFLQLGGRHEVKIEGAVDLRGTTEIRQAVAILKYVKSFVGVISFLAHAANAVRTPGVVLFGPSAPSVWGHPSNINLTRNMRCAPCIDVLLGDPCPYGAPCLSGITVEEVTKALAQQVSARENRESQYGHSVARKNMSLA